MSEENKRMREKVYIGDSVYLECGRFNGEFILTTNNGYDDDPRNQIFLEATAIDLIKETKDAMLRAKEEA